MITKREEGRVEGQKGVVLWHCGIVAYLHNQSIPPSNIPLVEYERPLKIWVSNTTGIATAAAARTYSKRIGSGMIG